MYTVQCIAYAELLLMSNNLLHAVRKVLIISV